MHLFYLKSVSRRSIYNESVIFLFREVAIDGNDTSIICNSHDIRFLYAVRVTRLKFWTLPIEYAVPCTLRPDICDL